MKNRPEDEQRHIVPEDIRMGERHVSEDPAEASVMIPPDRMAQVTTILSLEFI